MTVLSGAGFTCIPELKTEENESAPNLHGPKYIAALHTHCLHMLTWYLYAEVLWICTFFFHKIISDRKLFLLILLLQLGLWERRKRNTISLALTYQSHISILVKPNLLSWETVHGPCLAWCSLPTKKYFVSDIWHWRWDIRFLQDSWKLKDHTYQNQRL